MRLSENQKFPTSREVIEEQLDLMRIRKYVIHDDGTVDVDGTVHILSNARGFLPLKFGNVTGFFDCSGCDLISLEGAPSNVGSNFVCDRNKLTSFEFMPADIGGHCELYMNPIKSLVGINDHCNSIGKTINIGRIIESAGSLEGGLGLLLIDGLQEIVHAKRLSEPNAFQIINGHLKDKDVFACQQELIENGFERNAII